MKKLRPILFLFIIVALIYTLSKKFITYPSEKFQTGIDISEHQGEINWKKVNTDEVSFVIIRSSYGTTTDQYFHSNYRQAKEKDLDIGIYHYLYATTKEGAIQEAEYLLDIISGYSFNLPIYIDIEDENVIQLSQQELNEIILSFLTTLTDAGYEAGYYTNVSIYFKYLNTQSLAKYPAWIAQYADVLINLPNADLWQYSNTGRISGIDTDVDLNYMLNAHS